MPQTRWRSYARRALFVILILCAAAALIEHVLELRDEARLAANETFYSVDGRRIRYHLTGRSLPGPTLILLNGGHSSLEQWGAVQSALGTIAPVLSYDRVGTGFSDATDGAHDANAQAQELDQLLHSPDIARPFVLVGYSAGALVATVFAARHMDVVKGIAFLDPILSAAPGTKSWRRILWRPNVLNPIEAFFGYARLIRTIQRRNTTPLSPEAERSNALLESTHHWLACSYESVNLDKSAAEADAAMATHPFVRLPLAVLSTGTPANEYQRDIFDRQQQLAASSAQGLFRTVHAEHSELLYDPAVVGSIVDLVRTVVDEVRTGGSTATAGGSP